MNSWGTAVQLHSTVKAIEHTTGQAVTGVIVQGLYKGYESYGKQGSPFCYAYHRAGNPPFTTDQYEYEYKPGFRRVPTWEMDGGVKGWVARMPDTLLVDQFPQVPPIFVKEDLLSTFIEQTAFREDLIRATRVNLADPAYADEHAALLNRYFPQRFDQCQPAWGRPCGYRKLCHGRVEDPLSEGFEWRQAHHQPEAEQQEQEG